MFPDNSFGLLHLNLHSGNMWYQYKTLGLRTNTSRESKSYFPSSSYSWYSSVKRVQVVVAISQPSAFATISELCVQHYDYSPVPSTCGILKTKLQRGYGFEWGRGSPTSRLDCFTDLSPNAPFNCSALVFRCERRALSPLEGAAELTPAISPFFTFLVGV